MNLPRPDPNQAIQDVDRVYTLAAKALQEAHTPSERLAAFREALMRAYEAGVAAQRQVASGGSPKKG